MIAKTTALLVGMALLPGSLLAQSAEVADKQSARALAEVIGRSPHAHGNVLNVKLVEGCGAELVDGRLRSRVDRDLSTVQRLFDQGLAEPLVTALPWDELDRWHKNACANLPPGRGPGHLGLWFRLTTPTDEIADDLFARLWELDLVEHCVKEGRPTPASVVPPLPHDIPPTTPLFTGMQQDHTPSPLGYGIWQSQGILGARGQGINFRMVELEWNLFHEDVHDLDPINFIGPVPQQGTSSANHGTAGASLVVADRNEYGITGVADEVDMKFSSQATNNGLANALILAGASAQPGDVVLQVLMYLLAQTGSSDWVPYEFLQPVFDAVLTLTGNGLIVVSSAANGDNNLDDPRFLRRFDRSFRDSGAIMVGATEGSQLVKAWFANYGSRVDANGWGDGVVACGIASLFFPNMDRRQAYTAAYAGTSAAVPKVAGIVAAIQGAAERQLGARLSRTQIQQLIWTHGPLTPDPIGRRPDLWAILQAIGAVDGLELGHPDVPIGGTETVTVRGPNGSGAFMFASFDTGNLDLGYNRPIHLALSTMITIGFLPMPTGSASLPVSIPNDPSFRGMSLFFQAGVLSGPSPVHVTNSVQLTIV